MYIYINSVGRLLGPTVPNGLVLFAAARARRYYANHKQRDI